MAFAARFKGTCIVCKRTINVGETISWNRKAGGAWHDSCKPSTAATAPATRPTPTPEPATAKPISIADLAALMSKLGIAIPHPEPTPETPETVLETEPEPADYGDFESEPETIDAETEPTPKPSRQRSKPSKLSNSSPWYDILPAVIPHLNRLLLIGPPSSGKSTTSMLVAGIKHRITMTETTSKEELLGQFHLIEGSTKWIDGPVTTAMRNGEPVLIDEIDRYSPECASLCYAIIDDKPHATLPNGETIVAKDGFKVLMTSNESLETLPAAVQDRIEAIIMASVPHPDSLSELPDALRELTIRTYETKARFAPGLRLEPSVRRMRAFHKLMSFVPSDVAARLVFGAAGASEVLSVIASVEGTR